MKLSIEKKPNKTAPIHSTTTTTTKRAHLKIFEQLEESKTGHQNHNQTTNFADAQLPRKEEEKKFTERRVSNRLYTNWYQKEKEDGGGGFSVFVSSGTNRNSMQERCKRSYLLTASTSSPSSHGRRGSTYVEMRWSPQREPIVTQTCF